MKKIIVILIMLLVLAILILGVYKLRLVSSNKEQNYKEEEYTDVLNDGTKVNTSNKLSEKKIFDEMEITDIQITEKDNVTELLATVTNVSNTTKGGYPILITIYDKDGVEITVANGYLKELKPGEQTKLSSSKTFDYANAYDFNISKKE